VSAESRAPVPSTAVSVTDLVVHAGQSGLWSAEPDGQELDMVGRFALVFPAEGRWVPLLIEGPTEAGGPLEPFVRNATFTWLHYAYAEDHGLWLRFFQRTEQKLQLEFQSRGPSGLCLEVAVDRLRELHLVDEKQVDAIRRAVLPAMEPTAVDPAEHRNRLSEALGVSFFVQWSCADLTYSSLKALSKRAPTATPVLKSKRGKCGADQPPPEPNEFCPIPGLPAFMYAPLPHGTADLAMVTKHVRHWVETGDFDNCAQEGFWLHTAYSRALPSRYRFLADRVMNLASFPNYEAALETTIRSILAVSERDFDWEPYLRRRKGTQRL